MSPRGLFVAGSHTDIGKTYVACAILRAARRAGLAVDALKPVVSGFDAGDWSQSDPGRLLTALGRDLTTEALDRISPWRFIAPLAPPMAAALEGRSLALADLADACRRGLAASTADLMVVEGVGGLMSPIADRATGLDLVTSLGLTNVLVVGSYLGSISHALTALETLRSHGLGVSAMVVSQDAGDDAPDFQQTVASLRDFVGDTPLFAAGRDSDRPWSDELVALVMEGRTTTDGKR
jgi:dethiobiotin synthetase